MNKTSIISILLGLTLAISGCVTVSQKSVQADITSYEYDQNPFNKKYKLKKSDPVQAAIVTESDQEAGTTNLYLLLTTNPGTDNENHLKIYEKDAAKFKQLLNLKMRVASGAKDQQISLMLNHLKFMIQTKFIKDERVIAMGSIDGFFAFKEYDVNEIIRLLNGLSS